MLYAEEAIELFGTALADVYLERARISRMRLENGLRVSFRRANDRHILNAFDPESPVLWLCGAAGVGKSSVVISVAKALEEMGLLGSMYSFQAAKQAILNPTNLFSTIARHLAQHNPVLEKRLIEIIRESRPNIRATSSPKDQFERLLLPLLTHNNSQTIVLPTVIIIDAFDECGNIGSRREVLDILTRRAHEFPLGVRILITSRNEADVQDALASQPKNVCLLKMEHIPRESTYSDIFAYVHEALRDVRGVNAEQFVPQLTKLAVAAEESFQWASTACLFIQNEDDGDGVSGPEDRLSRVLKSNEGLDNLYRTVLDRHFGASKLKTLEPPLALLGYLAYACEPLCLDTMASLSAISSASPNVALSTFQRIARMLSSLMMGTQDVKAPLVALHTSFTDFLRDERRSQKYFVDRLKFHEHLAAHCLCMMDTRLRFNICDIPTSFTPNVEIENIQELIQKHIPDALSYACRYWAYHLSQVGAWSELDRLRDSVTTLLSDHVLEWLEVMSLTESVPLNSLGWLESIHQIPPHYSHLSTLVHETSQFAAYFAVPIMKSAAHIYLSALPFTPLSSRMFHRLHARFIKTVQVAAGELVAWPSTRHILEGHTEQVNCVAFSPVAHLIASGSHDGTIRVWDTSKGRVDSILRGHSSSVQSVAFSPDGTLIASGSGDHTIRIWDVTTRTAAGEPLYGHSGDVLSVALSPNGTLLASGSHDCTIRIWDVRTRTAVGEPLGGHTGYVQSVAFSPNSTLIASGSYDKTIRIWDVITGGAVGEPLEGHSHRVLSVEFSPDGKIIASGLANNTICLWDVKTRTAVGEPLEGHSGYVQSIAFSPDGTLMASGSGDNTIRVWDIKTRTAVGEPLEGHTGYVQSVAFSPDRTLIASGSYDRTIRIWDVTTHTAVEEPFQGHSRSVESVALSLDGTLIASSSNDKTIRIWDLTTRTAIGEPLKGHFDKIPSVASSPDGMLIASCSWDHTIRIWDITTHNNVGEPLKGHYHPVESVVFSPDGTLIASGSWDNTIRIWDITTRTALGKPLSGHSKSVRSVAFSPNGTLIASGSYDKTIRIWDVTTHIAIGEPLHGHSDAVRSVAFSPDGTLIASGSWDNTVRIWDVATRTAVGEPLYGHSKGIQSVAFSPDGTIIASGSFDRTIRIWHVPTRTAVGEPLCGHSDWVQSLAFSPNGTHIVSGSRDKTVRIWDIHAEIESDVFAHGGDSSSSGLLQSSIKPHPTLRSMRRLEEGWIVGPRGELILWIPPTQRFGLGDNRMLAVLGNPNVRHTLLNFDNMEYGSEWARCRTIDS